MQKYSIGSKVVHSPEGVCVVEAVCRMKLDGEEREMYKLRSTIEPEKLVYIPVDSAIMKLRLLKSRQEVLHLLQLEPEDRTFLAQNTMKREKLQNQAIYGDDTSSIMKLLKLYTNKSRIKTLSILEKTWMKKAEQYLYSEIAEVLECEYTALINSHYGIAC
ncbi:MAG: CarD family transcriptional regulator [Lachnospiraceae bacterium]|nr:CarD family transcriptional regulator [Lachnospiraceae bacterium]